MERERPLANAAMAWEDVAQLAKVGLVLLFLLHCLRLLANTTADLDLWGYLAFGRLFWQTGAFPYHDIFTYVPTHPLWVYHEWLTGVLFYPLYNGLGPWALQLLKNVVALSTLALIYLTARRRGADFWGALAMLWVISGFLKSGYSPVRAQVFTYFFFALSLFLLETAKGTQSWARLMWLIPIQIIWSNLHGGFLAGLGLVGIFAVGEALARRPFRAYLVFGVLAGLATLINPYGLDYWRYLLAAVSMPRPEIVEWTSTFTSLSAGAYQVNSLCFIIIVYFAVALLAWSRSGGATVYLALAVTLYLSLRHVRHQIFFLLLSAVYLAAPFSAYLARFRNLPITARLWNRLDYRWLATAYAVVFIMLTVHLATLRPLQLLTPSVSEQSTDIIQYPTGAVTFIQRHALTGNLLADFDWGEYLLWRLYPQCRIAIDGRYETVYPEKVVRPYMDFIFARADWQRFLQDYPPDMILIKNNSRIFKLLQADANWQQVFTDQGSVLFVRSDHSLSTAWEARR